MMGSIFACIPKWGRTLVYLWLQMNQGLSTINSGPEAVPSLTPSPQSLAPAFLGGRAYSALPCAGAPPPQRPLSCSRRSEIEGNMTVSARGGRASPHPPSRSPGCRPFPCPSATWSMDSKQFQPPLARFLHLTFLAPNLNCTPILPRRRGNSRHLVSKVLSL